MKKNNEILAYAAGIVDGEGHISIVRNAAPQYRIGYMYRLTVGVTNTNVWLINWMQFQFGGKIYQRCDKRPNRKTAWVWLVHQNGASEFLKLILPYLLIKKPQAELAIQFQSAKHPGKRHTPESKVIEQAQKILMTNYNRKGRHPNVAMATVL